MSKNLEKYKIKDTHGVLVVTLDQFAFAVIDNYTKKYNVFSIEENNEYYIIKGCDPYYKCGYIYTLLLEKERYDLNDLMYEIFWQINEINKDKKKEILKVLKEEFDIEDE